ncbi:hypothetical protein PLEOSDRAFT_1021103, partial [Pleurotus ostreatus PC15]
LHEGLAYIAEAHIRVNWLAVAGVESLADLRSKSPEELKMLAAQILHHHASTEALEKMQRKPDHQRDEVLEQAIMFNHDVLQYLVLDRAIKGGDIGVMEDMLLHLFIRFLGNNNSNYSQEILKCLQGLHKEWLSEIKDFICQHCWLVNSTGRENWFTPIDMAQEHNIKDIKVIMYRSEGPSVDWEYLKKLNPAIPTIRILSNHVEEQFGTQARSTSHS